jgi:hypothetical protein
MTVKNLIWMTEPLAHGNQPVKAASVLVGTYVCLDHCARSRMHACIILGHHHIMSTLTTFTGGGLVLRIFMITSKRQRSLDYVSVFLL